MWESLKRYRALDRESRHLFWRALLLLTRLGVQLRVRGYNQTLATLQTKLRVSGTQLVNGTDSAGYLDQACRMVRVAAHYSFGKPSCLEQSLALWYLLERRGISAQLRIGVRKNAGKFEAHAWVERDGVALNQPDEMHRHYAAFEKELAGTPVERS
jgi:hypothetical protein